MRQLSNLLIARCLGGSRSLLSVLRWEPGDYAWCVNMLGRRAGAQLPGCGVGLRLAQLAIVGVHKLPPGTIPQGDLIDIHWTVVLVLAAIAIVTTVLSSLLPALIVSRANPQAALQSASRGVGRGPWEESSPVAWLRWRSRFPPSAGGNWIAVSHTLESREIAGRIRNGARITTFTAMPPDRQDFPA